MSLVTASELDRAHSKSRVQHAGYSMSCLLNCRLLVGFHIGVFYQSSKSVGIQCHSRWQPCDYKIEYMTLWFPSYRVGLFEIAAQNGGRSHQKLNIVRRPIAKKYSDGKVKSALKRRWKVLENVKGEKNATSVVVANSSLLIYGGVSSMFLWKCAGFIFIIGRVHELITSQWEALMLWLLAWWW